MLLLSIAPLLLLGCVDAKPLSSNATASTSTSTTATESTSLSLGSYDYDVVSSTSSSHSTNSSTSTLVANTSSSRAHSTTSVSSTSLSTSLPSTTSSTSLSTSSSSTPASNTSSHSQPKSDFENIKSSITTSSSHGHSTISLPSTIDANTSRHDPTTSLQSRSTKTSSSHSITSPASIASALGNNFTFTNYTTAGNSSAYYNPYFFRNPYFFDIIATSGAEALSSLHSCAAIWTDAFNEWKSTAPVSVGPIVSASTTTITNLPWISSQAATTQTIFEAGKTRKTTISSLATTVLPQTITQIVDKQGPLYYVQSGFDWTASQPCCEACRIGGGKVDVFYWPTETQSANFANATQTAPAIVSTLVNEAGFTFTSPSIYVAFQSLYASNYCGDVGSRIAASTLAFKPGELSTSDASWVWSSTIRWGVLANGGLDGAGDDVTWSKATWGDQTECGDKLRFGYNVGGSKYWDEADALSAASWVLETFPMSDKEASDLVTAFAFTYDPCLPTLSIPSQILTVNSEWKNCRAPLTAFYDPPYLLTAGRSGLFTAAPATSTEPATPAQTPEPVIASSTTAAGPPSSSPTTEIQRIKILTSTTDSSSQNGRPGSESTINGGVLQQTSQAAVEPNGSGSESTPERILPQQTTQSNSKSSDTSNLPASLPNNGGSSTPGTAESNNPVSLNPQKNTGAATPETAILSLGPSPIAADSSSNFVFGSQTLVPGGQLTISGTQVSLASDGAFAILDGTSTQNIATTALQTPSPGPAVLTFGSSSITADTSSNLLFGSQTLSPGGAVTVAGTQISLASNGAFAVIGGTSTQIIAPAPSSGPLVLGLGSSVITAAASSGFIIGPETLAPGAVATVSGTQISLASNGGYAVFGSTSTQFLSHAIPTLIAGSAVTISGVEKSLAPDGASAVMTTTSDVAASSNVEYVIASQTLSANGPAITVSGTVMSLLPGASSVVVGTETVDLGILVGGGGVVVGTGVGGMIVSIGGFGRPSATASPATATGTGGTGYNGTQFLGDAMGRSRSMWFMWLSLVVGVVGVFWL